MPEHPDNKETDPHRGARTGSAGFQPARKNEPPSHGLHTSDSQDVTTPPHKGWHYRGYLRHFDTHEHPQFVTFRLAGALPTQTLHTWRAELAHKTPEQVEHELRLRIENYLDMGHGPCYLKDSSVAELVQSALLHFHEQRYQLHAWVVMPNHVHLLFTPMSGRLVPEIIHTLKSFTANKANGLLGRKGRFWQVDYFDRYVRDEKHFRRVQKYIEHNPVAAGLCEKVEDWAFSSAYSGRKANSGGLEARAPSP